MSSIRADSLTEELVASLHRGGHRTLTIAPEAGTERLRHVIRKYISDEQIYEACDAGAGPRHPESEVLLHDRSADRDRRGRPGDPGPGDPSARAPARPGAERRPLRAIDPLDQLVRAEAVDPLPVGPLRPGLAARGQAPDHQGRRPAASRTCACSTRTRARPPCRRSSPGGTAGSRTSSRGRAPRRATGERRSGSGAATPTSTRPATGRSTRRCRGTIWRRRAESQPRPRAPAGGPLPGAASTALTTAEARARTHRGTHPDRRLRARRPTADRQPAPLRPAPGRPATATTRSASPRRWSGPRSRSSSTPT